MSKWGWRSYLYLFICSMTWTYWSDMDMGTQFFKWDAQRKRPRKFTVFLFCLQSIFFFLKEIKKIFFFFSVRGKNFSTHGKLHLWVNEIKKADSHGLLIQYTVVFFFFPKRKWMESSYAEGTRKLFWKSRFIFQLGLEFGYYRKCRMRWLKMRDISTDNKISA